MVITIIIMYSTMDKIKSNNKKKNSGGRGII
jgi:hypothetical protein